VTKYYFKSNIVILDDEMILHLGDFGPACLIGDDELEKNNFGGKYNKLYGSKATLD
jgi:hypothetical protein